MENKYRNYKHKNKKKENKEKKKTKVSDIDLREKRIIYLDGEIDDKLAKEIIETLLKMDACNNKDITMYINSGGGSVSSGLAIYDVMNMIKSDVRTICIGRAASMASVLLINGAKGKRFILPNAEIMIHEVSSFNIGKFTELKDRLDHTKSLNDRLMKIIASKTNRTYKQIKQDTINKDNWINSKNAVKYGFVDKVLVQYG